MPRTLRTLFQEEEPQAPQAGGADEYAKRKAIYKKWYKGRLAEEVKKEMDSIPEDREYPYLQEEQEPDAEGGPARLQPPGTRLYLTKYDEARYRVWNRGEWLNSLKRELAASTKAEAGELRSHTIRPTEQKLWRLEALRKKNLDLKARLESLNELDKEETAYNRELDQRFRDEQLAQQRDPRMRTSRGEGLVWPATKRVGRREPVPFGKARYDWAPLYKKWAYEKSISGRAAKMLETAKAKKEIKKARARNKIQRSQTSAAAPDAVGSSPVVRVSELLRELDRDGASRRRDSYSAEMEHSRRTPASKKGGRRTRKKGKKIRRKTYRKISAVKRRKHSRKRMKKN